VPAFTTIKHGLVPMAEVELGMAWAIREQVDSMGGVGDYGERLVAARRFYDRVTFYNEPRSLFA
jgi:hypothetical protein